MSDVQVLYMVKNADGSTVQLDAFYDDPDTAEHSAVRMLGTMTSSGGVIFASAVVGESGEIVAEFVGKR